VRMFSLLAGSMVIFLGILRAAREGWGAGGRVRAARRISDHAALGLEFFVAATILNLMLNPTWTAVAATAFTIAIRELLTISLRLARAG
ncbi:MAG: DUF1622 domain-containing protein, partial [Rubrobacteraceae bacterium]